MIAQNRLAEAEPLLRQMVATTPSNASAQYELGKLLDERGNTAEALAALQAAVAADADQDKAWYLLGRIYARKGDKAQADHAMAAVKEIKERRLRGPATHGRRGEIRSALDSGPTLMIVQYSTSFVNSVQS